MNSVIFTVTPWQIVFQFEEKVLHKKSEQTTRPFRLLKVNCACVTIGLARNFKIINSIGDVNLSFHLYEVLFDFLTVLFLLKDHMAIVWILLSCHYNFLWGYLQKACKTERLQIYAVCCSMQCDMIVGLLTPGIRCHLTGLFNEKSSFQVY